MRLFIDAPIQLLSDEGKVIRVESLRKYITESVKQYGDVGMLIDHFLESAINLVITANESTITPELAEMRIFSELRVAFSSEIAEEVFRATKRNLDYFRAWDAENLEGTFDEYIYRHFSGDTALDVGNLSESMQDLLDMLNAHESLKNKRGPTINNSPSDEGTSFN